MKSISSANNEIVKEASSLKEKKYRDALGLYLIEGPNLVRELLDRKGKARFIFLLAGAGPEAQELAQRADGLTAVYELSREAFSKIAADQNPQGIMAVAEKDDIDTDGFFEKVGEKDIRVLDRLQDPGNVGTLMRTAEALGFGGAVLIKGCADPYQPKAVRAAAGSVLRFPFIFCEDGKSAAALLKEKGKRLYAACMEGSVCVRTADIKENAAIIIGNEGNGVSAELTAEAEKLYIPMDGGT